MTDLAMRQLEGQVDMVLENLRMFCGRWDLKVETRGVIIPGEASMQALNFGWTRDTEI
jgi:hypothetical protein